MNINLLNVARRVRHMALDGLRTIGAFQYIAESTWRRRRLLILCYHGVSIQDEHEWDPQLFVSPSFLRRRFEILRRTGCNVLPLGKAVQSLKSNSLPPRSVVLTFDDGFHNFYTAAVPLLEEYGYPATNYISSYYCVHQRPILQLALRYLLWRASTRVLKAGTLPRQSDQVNLDIGREAQLLYENLLDQVRNIPHERGEQQAWLRDISDRLGVSWERIEKDRLFHLMTADELADIAARGFDIQLHTHRHRTPRDKQMFCSEVSENRLFLEQQTKRPTLHFCYPSGDVDQLFLPWLREMGVETATTGVAGLACRKSDTLLLPRYVDTMIQTETVFESWLSGASEIMRRRGF